MMRRRSPRARRRGMTLVEAIIALAVLTAGVAGIFQIIAGINNSQRTLRLNSQGLDLYSRLASEIRDARCDYLAVLGVAPVTSGMAGVVRDPGLTVENQWIPAVTPSPAGSSFRTFGSFNGEGMPVAPAAAVINVDYRVRPIAIVGVNPLTYEIDVRVRQLQNDAVKDAVALENGTWMRVFTVQKVCNARTDGQAPVDWRG